MEADEYLPFDPKDVGVLEMVHYPTLKAILDACGDNEELLKQTVIDNLNNLVPKRILTDDVVGSVSYLHWPALRRRA